MVFIGFGSHSKTQVNLWQQISFLVAAQHQFVGCSQPRVCPVLASLAQ